MKAWLIATIAAIAMGAILIAVFGHELPESCRGESATSSLPPFVLCSDAERDALLAAAAAARPRYHRADLEISLCGANSHGAEFAIEFHQRQPLAVVKDACMAVGRAALKHLARAGPLPEGVSLHVQASSREVGVTGKARVLRYGWWVVYDERADQLVWTVIQGTGGEPWY